MFFSPITERSFKVQALYIAIYTALILGGITIITPFIIMLSGSLEPGIRFTDSIFFPRYLINQEILWKRYIESKYGGNADFYRMAISNPTADFQKTSLPPSRPEDLKMWQEFSQNVETPEDLWAVGFLRSYRRMPSYYGREFRNWLLKKSGGTLASLNQALGTKFFHTSVISPPLNDMTGAVPTDSPLARGWDEFKSQIPEGRKFAWDAGGYYRAIFLPRVLGGDIEVFNKRYGTHFKSYGEVPFSAMAPDLAIDQWLFYVTRVLRQDFVDLTEVGETRRKQSGLTKEEFLVTLAKPEDLQVVTLDRKFAEWAREKYNILDARIPQAQRDLVDFEHDAGFWKMVFLRLNYLTVIDEVLRYGRAIMNTLILVTLTVLGALIINPLAAYALSRFKLRQTYFILLFFLATISFPAEVTLIPVFLQLKQFHLLNTFGALVLPTLANGFSIFLLKGFFDSLPKELYEAAEIDGASEAMMFWQITMNLSKPILAVIALGAFVNAYGAFFYALIVAPDPKMWTVMVYIFQLRQTVDAPVVYASLILTAIPTLLVFIFCQNIILRGIVVPADK